MNQKRGCRHIFAALLASAVLTTPVPAIGAYGSQEPPRILNLWFDWRMPDEELARLAKWDIIVLDMDQQARNPDRIRKLRTLNPKAKILAYISSSNIAAARFVEEPHFPGYRLAHAIPEEWYMHRGTQRVGFWSGAWLLNNTAQGPTDSKGRRWTDFLPEFIATELWSTGLWDGIFLDDALPGATYFVGGGLDATGDGKADDDAWVNSQWQAGWKHMAAELRRRLGPNALIMGNGSVQYASDTNGILFESFPRYGGWAQGFRDYQTAIRTNARPSITAFNANTNNSNTPTNYALMRFTLVTSMLADGYFSFDFGEKNHGQTWWYDEYDAQLGPASVPATLLEPAGESGIVEGVWWREYARGAVLVNSTKDAKRITLASPYERLRGTQDPTVNNGKIVAEVDIPAQDGLLLYRRIEPSALKKSSDFRNGSFVRVYAKDGMQVRSAFFAQRAGVPGGARVVIADADGDGKTDVFWSKDGAVSMQFGNGTRRTIRPFGSAYRGDISLAVGNVDRDSALELVVGIGNKAQVRVLELSGVSRAAWDAYVPWFRGGVHVAIGDLDGDGLREIVTGAGPTGGPHIRIWQTDGNVWGGGFFAFDAKERGGVSVAVGDVNGDGKDEIIAGSGEGSIPRVRVFAFDGTLLNEFTLASHPSAIGVHVSVSDIDDDGVPEILASGIEPAS
ncbi:VCBS repeat-containing protein [Patescibacteria group bacterium]|nr:VCBS repeat-containing protein [Patescibacteria group bacterium]MDL1952876.1 hypothetical protein [Candidatus Uhrbacteria bacterium UHB]RIL01110.1 MAG: hypothetical protein DCC77_01040 [Candidatus Uhrbacteria bacterium]